MSLKPAPGKDFSAGAVLVGGAGRRMGRDKASLLLGGRTLLDRAVERLLPLVRPLYLAGQGHEHPCAITLPDAREGLGPLSGIRSVLAAAPSPRVLVLAVDTPLVRGETLQRLLHLAQEFDDDVRVVQTPDGGLHPLCGVYSRRCLPAIEAALERRRLRVDTIFGDPGLRVAYADMELLHCSPEEFLNVNTPEDYRRVCAMTHDE